MQNRETRERNKIFKSMKLLRCLTFLQNRKKLKVPGEEMHRCLGGILRLLWAGIVIARWNLTSEMTGFHSVMVL